MWVFFTVVARLFPIICIFWYLLCGINYVCITRIMYTANFSVTLWEADYPTQFRPEHHICSPKNNSILRIVPGNISRNILYGNKRDSIVLFANTTLREFEFWWGKNSWHCPFLRGLPLKNKQLSDSYKDALSYKDLDPWYCHQSLYK